MTFYTSMSSFMLKLLFAFSICLCIYLLYLLLQRRNSYFYIQSKQQALEEQQEKEGFLVKNNLVPMNDTFAEMPLKEYVIKASFNSAYGSDEQISKENLRKIIEDEGVRFLDFGIYEQGNTPVVGFSNSYDNVVGSENTMPFSKVMDAITTYAFACKNGRDPLFLHLRIKSQSPSILSSIASTLQTTFGDKIYENPVSGDTKLNVLTNKVIFVMDNSAHYGSGYETILCGKGDKECINLSDIIHMDTSELLSTPEDRAILQQTNPPGASHGRRTEVQRLRMTTPNLSNYSGVNTSYFFKLVHDYSVQIVFHQFYTDAVISPDENLLKYKAFFQKQSSAFVPFVSALSYINTNGGPED